MLASGGSKRQSTEVKRRRGGRNHKASEKPESGGSASEREGEEQKTDLARRCAWPEKPRLPEEKFREFRAECRRAFPDTCFAFFLVGTCKDTNCKRSHEAPAAFEGVKQKFR